MKKAIIILIILFLFMSLSARTIGVLKEVMKPDNITIYKDQLYVMEGATVLVYTLPDLDLIRKFGKRGEGPGELKVIPGRFYNRVNLRDKYILTESVDKIIFFTHDGKLIRELRKGELQMAKTQPVGKNYVALKVHADPKTRLVLNSVVLFDPEFREKMVLYSQPFVQQGAVPNLKVDMVSDFVHFQVYKDKIYIEESPKGFVIEVFDSEGNKLNEIQKNYTQIKVTARDREYILNRLKNDPNTRAQGGYNVLKNVFKPIYADYFPAIQSLEVSSDRIYLQTFHLKNGKEEYVVLDLQGNELQRLFVPRFENVPLLAEILGATLQTIRNNKLYYVMENEDDESWELHVEAIE
jgi:hypothetical protein